MSNLVNHAWNEFRAAGWCDEHGKFKDEMQKSICTHVVELLEKFFEEGHSGTTAPYTVDLFSNLALFKPIVPLTGEDWEWVCHSDERPGEVSVYQNKRCSAVFKQSDRFDGHPYYLDGRVFWNWYRDKTGEMSKAYFTSSDSSVPITFPYTPTTEYVFCPTEEFPNETL